MLKTTTHLTPAYHTLDLVWRSLLVGIAHVLAITAGGLLAQLLRLPLPAVPSDITPAATMTGMFVTGVVLGLVLGPLAARLNIPAAQRTGLLFLLLFMLNVLINQIEALFFTTMSAAELGAALVVSAVGHATLAVLLAVLFRPSGTERRLGPAIRAALAQRSWISWTWRFLLAGFLYLPTYLLFGMIVSPFVVPYYNNPELGLGLVIPGVEVIVSLEVVRGLLFALTVFPLVALLGGSRRSLALWIGLTIAVLGAWAPMIEIAWWPPALRLAHGLEISGDSLVQGLTIAWLLGPANAIARR